VERDETQGTLHNSLFAISAAGELLGRHRKINTLRVGSEAWSVPDSKASPRLVSQREGGHPDLRGRVYD
jgi:predicted amidohydrolase